MPARLTCEARHRHRNLPARDQRRGDDLWRHRPRTRPPGPRGDGLPAVAARTCRTTAAIRNFARCPCPGLPIPGYPLLRLGLPARRRLTRRWRADRPDLVHVATEGPLGASAVTAARALGLPVTSSFHTNFHVYAGHYGSRRCAGSPSPGCATCTTARSALSRRPRNFATNSPRPVSPGSGVLSRGVDPRQFSPAHRSPALRAAWGAANGEVVVLHVGRIAAEKNYPLLFRAYAAMRGGKSRPALRPGRRRSAAPRPAGGASRMHLHRLHSARRPRPPLRVGRRLRAREPHRDLWQRADSRRWPAASPSSCFDYAAARQFVRHGANGLAVPCDQPDAFVAAATELAHDRLPARPVARRRRRLVQPASHGKPSSAVSRLTSPPRAAPPPDDEAPHPHRRFWRRAQRRRPQPRRRLRVAGRPRLRVRGRSSSPSPRPRFNRLARRAYLAAINGSPGSGADSTRGSTAAGFSRGISGCCAPSCACSNRCPRSASGPPSCAAPIPSTRYLLERLARAGRLAVPPFYNVVTDSISIHSLWTRPGLRRLVRAQRGNRRGHARAWACRRQSCMPSAFPVPAFFNEHARELAPPDLAAGARSARALHHPFRRPPRRGNRPPTPRRHRLGHHLRGRAGRAPAPPAWTSSPPVGRGPRTSSAGPTRFPGC